MTQTYNEYDVCYRVEYQYLRNGPALSVARLQHWRFWLSYHDKSRWSTYSAVDNDLRGSKASLATALAWVRYWVNLCPACSTQAVPFLETQNTALKHGRKLVQDTGQVSYDSHVQELSTLERDIRKEMEAERWLRPGEDQVWVWKTWGKPWAKKNAVYGSGMVCRIFAFGSVF
jgi:hypothetical protein